MLAQETPSLENLEPAQFYLIGSMEFEFKLINPSIKLISRVFTNQDVLNDPILYRYLHRSLYSIYRAAISSSVICGKVEVR